MADSHAAEAVVWNLVFGWSHPGSQFSGDIFATFRWTWKIYSAIVLHWTGWMKWVSGSQKLFRVRLLPFVVVDIWWAGTRRVSPASRGRVPLPRIFKFIFVLKIASFDALLVVFYAI